MNRSPIKLSVELTFFMNLCRLVPPFILDLQLCILFPSLLTCYLICSCNSKHFICSMYLSRFNCPFPGVVCFSENVWSSVAKQTLERIRFPSLLLYMESILFFFSHGEQGVHASYTLRSKRSYALAYCHWFAWLSNQKKCVSILY